MRGRIRFVGSIFALLISFAFLARGDGSPSSRSENTGKNVVYVCACLKTKSCSCMTEAKTEGPCACGTEGGPPMKAVPSDSAWAKENREALARKE
jgi:hypothetical protein